MGVEISPEHGTHTFVEKVHIAGNKGPCGGVNMAWEATCQALDLRDRFAGHRIEAENPEDIDPKYRVYSLWDIVHNTPVMEELSKRGLVSVNMKFNLIPRDAVAIKPAHGGPRSLDQLAMDMNWQMIDVTCQLVTRVQNLALRAEEQGKHIAYIGVDGHPETIGVMGNLKSENVTLFEKPDDVQLSTLPANKPAIVFSQTTLSPKEVIVVESALQVKYPEIEVPNRLDICYATYNRQEAVERLLIEQHINMLIVVGSRHSHNSKELRALGLLSSIPSYLIDYPQDLRLAWFTPWIKSVGITSGASVFDRFLQPVVDKVVSMSPLVQMPIFEEQVIPEGDLTFKLPQKDIEALRRRWAV